MGWLWLRCGAALRAVCAAGWAKTSERFARSFSMITSHISSAIFGAGFPPPAPGACAAHEPGTAQVSSVRRLCRQRGAALRRLREGIRRRESRRLGKQHGSPALGAASSARLQKGRHFHLFQRTGVRCEKHALHVLETLLHISLSTIYPSLVSRERSHPRATPRRRAPRSSIAVWQPTIRITCRR